MGGLGANGWAADNADPSWSVCVRWLTAGELLPINCHSKGACLERGCGSGTCSVQVFRFPWFGCILQGFAFRTLWQGHRDADLQSACGTTAACLCTVIGRTGWETWCHRVRLHAVTYAVFFCMCPEGIGSMARTWVRTCGGQILSLEETPPPPCRAGPHAGQQSSFPEGSHTVCVHVPVCKGSS